MMPVLIIICGILYFREAKIIGILYGSENQFAKIGKNEYITSFEKGKPGKYIGKVKDGEALFRVYMVKNEKDQRSLIILGVEGENYIFKQIDRQKED